MALNNAQLDSIIRASFRLLEKGKPLDIHKRMMARKQTGTSSPHSTKPTGSARQETPTRPDATG